MLKSNLLLCAGTYELHMKLRNHDQLDWKYQIKDVTHQTVRSKHYIFSYPKMFTNFTTTDNPSDFKRRVRNQLSYKKFSTTCMLIIVLLLTKLMILLNIKFPRLTCSYVQP